MKTFLQTLAAVVIIALACVVYVIGTVVCAILTVVEKKQ